VLRIRTAKPLYHPVGQTSEEVNLSVYPSLSEPLDDYRDLPANVAASALLRQPKQRGLELGVHLHPHSLPKLTPRHHPHISPHAVRNASLICAVCIFYLSKVFYMRLENSCIHEYRTVSFDGWKSHLILSSKPCSRSSILDSFFARSSSGQFLSV
jgi:hypothetical protein